jgi:hypothetical protein
VTAAVLERPSLFAERRVLDAGPTLEELLDSAFHEALTNGSTECPVCHASMTSARAGAREAVCGGCGSKLS